ncbi:Zinc transporter ZupT [Propionispora sp. 2/2-37]|uniref:zinc transporter ZupT n=1 Tax=Propionispora sp. 2/2-37 TaxID=1677858 RepID=UPI0006BB8DAA|nr:zinc transporter ZupT [Propionispora sp. 2/2-37]CUH95236.1 Zinc transporter ZupT [Propionispora sp. 2/2-37]
MQENFWLAFALTSFAGLSTGIGSLMALFAKRTDTRLLCAALGFSAGVMIYVSMIELMSEAKASLVHYAGHSLGGWLAVGGFFGGMLLISLIDRLVPHPVNPHEVSHVEKAGSQEHKDQKLLRMGVFTGLAVAIHNFPEGIASFLATINDPAMGMMIAVAIAIHNIPEGIAVSLPIFYATGSQQKAFLYSFLSGVAEPVGAIIGYLFLQPFLNEFVLGLTFAIIAGIMVFISFDELLPAAEQFGEHHLSIYGLISGMLIMAVSLLLAD